MDNKCSLLLCKLRVSGFKSLRDVEIELKPGVNVVVGPNASGKSNLVDLFLFLRRALHDELGKVPYAPHTPWGEARSLTWEARGEPIRVTLEYSLGPDGYQVIYEVVFSLVDGVTLKPIEEYIRVPSLNAALIRIGNVIEVYFGRRMWRGIENVIKNINSMLRGFLDFSLTLRCDASGCYVGNRVSGEMISVLQLLPLTSIPMLLASRVFALDKSRYVRLYLSVPFNVLIVWPETRCACLRLDNLLKSLRSFVARIIALRLINHYEAKRPHPPGARDRLEQDARNLAEILYTLMRDPRKYARLEAVVGSLFPWLRVTVEFDEYGNIVLVFYERRDGFELRLQPAMVPEGVVKLLAVMAGILSEPSVLVIDEIEDSMHARMIERIFDELRDMKAPVILTTHSPVVVDLAGPERIIVFRRARDGSTLVERIKKPEKLMKILEEEGVTLGYYYVHALPESDTA